MTRLPTGKRASRTRLVDRDANTVRGQDPRFAFAARENAAGRLSDDALIVAWDKDDKRFMRWWTRRHKHVKRAWWLR